MSNVNQSLSPGLLESKVGGSALSPLVLKGARRGKKLRVVKKKTVKKLLRRFGMKMRGMGPEEEVPMAGGDEHDVPGQKSGVGPTEGGRRRRGSRKTRRGSRKSRQ